MVYSSHRLRAQERNIVKKLIWSLILFFGAVFFAVFIGLPLLAKIVVGISSFNNTQEAQEKTSVSLFSPNIEPLPPATNSASIAIYGISDKNRKIVLDVNGEKKESETDDTGKFSFRGINLKEGENRIEATTKFEEQESRPATILITYKKDLPELQISEPSDGQRYFGERAVTIKGLTEADAIVNVNDRFVIVDRDGNFSYTTDLKDGENTFKFRSEDIAGNTSEKEIKLHYSP